MLCPVGLVLAQSVLTKGEEASTEMYIIRGAEVLKFLANSIKREQNSDRCRHDLCPTLVSLQRTARNRPPFLSVLISMRPVGLLVPPTNVSIADPLRVPVYSPSY